MWRQGMVLGCFFLLSIPTVWATSDDAMTIAPSATSGATILASDENARSTTIESAFEGHSHVSDTELDRSARVRNSSSLSLASGTATILTFDSERWDTDTIHSTSSNTGRLTATTAGKYQITGHVEMEIGAVSGERRLDILLNGTTIIASQDCYASGNTSSTIRCSVTTHYNLSATEYVELRATQRVQASLNVNASGNYSPEFEMVKVP